MGQKKPQREQAVLEGAKEPDRFPAQIISPSQGTLPWLVDRAAAQSLHSEKEIA